MPKCSRNDCEESEVFTLKLRAYAEGVDEPATMYLRFPVCEKHKLTDGEVHFMMRQNWEAICVGFDKLSVKRPILDRTEFAWVPFEEYIDFALEMERARNPKSQEHLQ